MSGIVGRPAVGVTEIELGDELSLFNPATGTAFALNRTARDVWTLADGTSTVEDVVAVLARSYRVDTESISEDVQAALVILTEAGLLVPAST